MKRPVPKPDYSSSGPARDAAFLASRAIPKLAERALLADEATNATNATNTTTVVTVDPKLTLDEDDLLALVTDSGRIQPVTLANLLAFLESRYVLTPIT